LKNKFQSMYILDPLCHNTLGSAFRLKNQYDIDKVHSKIQLLIGDISILLELEEIKSLLSVIRSAQKGCQCVTCRCANTKTIKLNTPEAEVVFKLSHQQLIAFEDLVLSILFNLEYIDILSLNEIY